MAGYYSFECLVLIGCAFTIAAAGGGAGYGISHYAKSHDGGATVGVRITHEQQILRRNGALCDAYLTQAFEQSLKENKVVGLELPQKPAQHCPETPRSPGP